MAAKKRKRKSRAMDPDLKALRAAYRAILSTQPRMQRPTLVFLWDKFVTHGPVSGPGAERAAR